jgi:hypothetical protein
LIINGLGDKLISERGGKVKYTSKLMGIRSTVNFSFYQWVTALAANIPPLLGKSRNASFPKEVRSP